MGVLEVGQLTHQQLVGSLEYFLDLLNPEWAPRRVVAFAERIDHSHWIRQDSVDFDEVLILNDGCVSVEEEAEVPEEL